MKQLFIFILLVFVTSISVHANTQNRSIYIVLSSGDAIYYDIAESLENTLKSTIASSPKINIITLESGTLDTIETEDLLIAIGAKAAQEVYRYQSSNTIIYSFVEQQLISKLNPAKLSKEWAAVTVNQPVKRLVSIAENLVKNNYKNKIIILLSKNNTKLKRDLANIQDLKKGRLETIEVESNDILAKVAEKSLFNAAALISTDEEAIWSGSNAKWLLREAYSYQVPVVGNSKRFLKAGALISVYSSMEKISQTTSLLIGQWVDNGLIINTGIHYVPSTIDINKNVAQALNYDENVLQTLKVDEQ